MTAIADDFAGIAARLKEVASPLAPKIAAEPEAPECETCDDAGWIENHNDNPAIRWSVCCDCDNPKMKNPPYWGERP